MNSICNIHFCSSQSFSRLSRLTQASKCLVPTGYMISCLAKNYQTALVLSTPLTLPIMLFGGFFVQAE